MPAALIEDVVAIVGAYLIVAAFEAEARRPAGTSAHPPKEKALRDSGFRHRPSQRDPAMYDGTMEYVLGPQGFLRDPHLHDGFVDGVRMADDKTAVLSLRDIRGQRFTMQLIGVERLVCDDFRQGNIILSIEIVSGMAPNMDALGSLFHLLPEEARDQPPPYLELRAKQVAEGSLVLVTIEPSYGCKLTALCRQVLISRD